MRRGGVAFCLAACIEQMAIVGPVRGSDVSNNGVYHHAGFCHGSLGMGERMRKILPRVLGLHC